MGYPIGHYHCKLDSKGRLLLPSEFKEQLDTEIEKGFVLRPALFSKSLEFYMMSDWMRIQEKLAGLNQFVNSNVELVRKFNAGARLAKLDAAGRLQIPKNLLDEGGLNKDVVVNSLTVKMEIWDKDAFEKAINSRDEDSYRKLYTEILGDNNFIG